MKTEDTEVLRNLELNQARTKPDIVNQAVRTACNTVHHCNAIQHCRTETILLISPFLQTNITAQNNSDNSNQVHPMFKHLTLR